MDKPCNCDSFFSQQAIINDLLAIASYYEEVIGIQLGPQELAKYRGFASLEKGRIQKERTIKPEEFLNRFS